MQTRNSLPASIHLCTFEAHIIPYALLSFLLLLPSISGATSLSYVPDVEDATHRLMVEYTPIRSDGSDAAPVRTFSRMVEIGECLGMVTSRHLH